MTLVAGVDSSTQSCKFEVRDTETGELVRGGHRPHPPTAPPRSEQDPHAWWEALSSLLDEHGRDIAAISVAGQQHGMVVLDAHRRVLRPAKLWNDTESAAQADALVHKWGAPAWADSVGSVPVASFTITKLAWLREHEPDVFGRIAHVLLPHDWLTLQLTGEIVTDRGDASGTGYWSSTTDDYLDDALALVGLDRAVVPAVRPPAARAGTHGDVVVGPGTGDNMGAALGLGLQAGDVAISLGTSGTVFAVSDRPTTDASGAVAGFADATGRFLPLVCTLNATKVTDTVARILGRTRDELEQMARSCSPGAGGVVLLPYLDGERTPNLPDATGAFAGIRSDTGPDQLARGVRRCRVRAARRVRRPRTRRSDHRPGPRARRRRRGAIRALPADARRSAAATGRGANPGRTRRAWRLHAGRSGAHRPRRRRSGHRVGTRRRAVHRARPGSGCECGARRLPRPTAPQSSRVRREIVKRTSFSDGWRVRPKANLFLEMFGGVAQSWQTVQLPHDAMIGGERDPDGRSATGYFPGGVWEYEKVFTTPDELRGKRVLLEFEGVYRGASVWVNGALAGHRPYGYTDFAVSIGEHLRHGEENVVKVHATAHDDARWYSGAGIYRPVHLVVGEPVHLALDAVQITTPSIDDGAVVAVATVVENESLITAATTVTTEIVDSADTVVARDVTPLTVFPGRTETLRQRLFVEQPRRWNVESPDLYTCRTVVESDGAEIDRQSVTFGIRTIDVDPERGLRINGVPVDLRGACIHHDNGVIGAATIPRADERRVERLKEAGFNALRSAHHPMSRAMLSACDRLGMLVMDEAFDMWTESKNDDDYGRVFPDWWEADVDAMVRKDRNHPSVIMYSIGNEIPDVGTPAGAALGRALAERIRALDATRLVTNSINPLLACGTELFASFTPGAELAPVEMGVNTMMTMMEQHLPVLLQLEIVDERTAEAFAYLDVCGYNYTESRYAMDHELHPQRVIVGSENHPKRIAANWELVREHSHVIGDFTWTGWDYLGESGIARVQYASDPADAPGGLLAPYPWITSNTGDIDITGFRRPVSYWREIVWGLRQKPYLAVRPPAHHGEESSFRVGWSFTDAVATWSWDGFEGEPVTVEVYADADEVELLLDGAAVGRSKVGELHPFVASFETTYAPGDITAVGYRGGAETGRASLTSATGPVQLDVQVDRAHIEATDRDLAFVDVTLVDVVGNLHSSEERAVTVAIDGPGMLQGFGSGNPRTEETFAAPTHDTYHGRALAVIRPTGAGTITISVSAEGCDDRTVTIEAA